MRRLAGRIRQYAWGSRTFIAGLQGRAGPTPSPEAELWLGAHPAAPATVDAGAGGGPVSLVDLLTAEPVRWLGQRVVRRYGARLPYLLKVLAADEPLSLQAHPDADQARAGHHAERDLPPDAHRNYADPNHKPELLVALSPFRALCGFREPSVSAESLDAFGVAELAPVTAALRAGDDGLADAVRTLLTWPSEHRAALVEQVAAADVADRFAADAALARGLARCYPGDPGVLVALLLNQVDLAPGEGIWMPAGNLHAYLCGAGVEIMAASDNVLRGGLTGKRVDVPELLRVLRFETLAEPVRAPVRVADGVDTWPVPVDDFALHRVRVDGGPGARLAVSGPRVLLAVAGGVRVDDGREPLTLAAGDSAIVPAEAGPLTFDGTGEVYVASVGG